MSEAIGTAPGKIGQISASYELFHYKEVETSFVMFRCNYHRFFVLLFLCECDNKINTLLTFVFVGKCILTMCV